MGTIGTEVFEISLSEMNIETVGGDEGIRNEDGNCGHTSINAHNKNRHLIHMMDGARVREKGKDVTHIVVNEIAGTEGHPDHAHNVGHSPRKPHHIDNQEKEQADLGRHSGCVNQWVTDGNMVICHC